MDHLASAGLPGRRPDRGARAAGGRPPPARTVGLTFDDGFADLAEHALPVLVEHGFRATVFVTTGVTDGRLAFPWYDRQPPVLGWDEVVELDRAGTLRFEAHTVSHPSLLAVDDAAAETEIRDSRLELESRLGRPVTRLRVSRRPLRRPRAPARRRRRLHRGRLLRAGRQRAARATGSRCAGARSTRATACSTSRPRSAAGTTRRCRCGATYRRLRYGRRGRHGGPARARRARDARPGARAGRTARGLAPARPRRDAGAARDPRAGGAAPPPGAPGSPDGTSSPVSPSATSSPTPPTSDATTGRPAAIASRIENGAPSERLDSTKTSAAASRAGTSDREPASSTRSLELERPDLRLHRGPVRPVAHQQRAERDRTERRQRAHQRQRVLGRGEPADGDDPGRVAVRARARRRVHVDGVRDHDGAAGAAGARREPGRALRLGDADGDGGQRAHQPVRPAVEERREAGCTP